MLTNKMLVAPISNRLRSPSSNVLASRSPSVAAFTRSLARTIAEIDRSVRLIDQQIERADAELAKLTQELSVDPVPGVRTQLEGAEFADTAIMKTLADMRSLLAQENTELLPAASEDLPTLKG